MKECLSLFSQAWQKARSEGWERSFCEKNFLSHGTMDMILGMRTQLLGQLRAIGQLQQFLFYIPFSLHKVCETICLLLYPNYINNWAETMDCFVVQKLTLSPIAHHPLVSIGMVLIH